MKYLFTLLLLIACTKNLNNRKRVVERVKQLYSEDSLLHPVMHVGLPMCRQDTLQDSIFVETDNNINANPGYIYTHESPQELGYRNGKFFWADDLDSVISNIVENY